MQNTQSREQLAAALSRAKAQLEAEKKRKVDREVIAAQRFIQMGKVAGDASAVADVLVVMQLEQVVAGIQHLQGGVEYDEVLRELADRDAQRVAKREAENREAKERYGARWESEVRHDPLSWSDDRALFARKADFESRFPALARGAR